MKDNQEEATTSLAAAKEIRVDAASSGGFIRPGWYFHIKRITSKCQKLAARNANFVKRGF